MVINKKLNLVLPVTTDKGEYHIHATPISLEVFERYFRIIGRTFAEMQNDGLLPLGPKMAYLMLKQIAVETGNWDGDHGVSLLLNEIIRLANVSIAQGGEWRNFPLDSVLKSGTFSDDDVLKIKGSLVFFICISAIHEQALVEATMNHMSGLWGLLTTSLSSTEYHSSLRTLTETDSSGETETPSSIAV